MTSRTLRLIALILGALLLAGLAVLGSGILRPSPPADQLTLSGRVEGRITTLSAKSAARVTDLPVDEGHKVKAGDILAVLSDPTQEAKTQAAARAVEALRAQLQATDLDIALLERQIAVRIAMAESEIDEMRARVERAIATLAQAKREADRYTPLAGQNVVSQQRLEDVRLQVQISQETLREAQAAEQRATRALDAARLERDSLPVRRAQREVLARQIAQAEANWREQQSYLDEFTLRSPIDGTVLARVVEVGERVTAGAPLFTLVDLNRLYVKVYVPEPQIGRITLNQPARIRTDAFPDHDVPARVARVAQQAEFTPKNVETREERVKLVFAVELDITANEDGALKPGMPVDATLTVLPPPAH